MIKLNNNIHITIGTYTNYILIKRYFLKKSI